MQSLISRHHHSSYFSTFRTARLLIEIHFKEQIKYLQDMARLNKMQENLFEVQGEVASGQRIEFHIPIELIGVSIGREGSRIKEVSIFDAANTTASLQDFLPQLAFYGLIFSTATGDCHDKGA